MFHRRRCFINDDHDPAAYRVCPHLHATRRIEIPTRRGFCISYICDTCRNAGKPCLVTPHEERGAGAGQRRIDTVTNNLWSLVAWATFGLIDPCRVYRSDETSRG
jgi:hypothetical protein